MSAPKGLLAGTRCRIQETAYRRMHPTSNVYQFFYVQPLISGDFLEPTRKQASSAELGSSVAVAVTGWLPSDEDVQVRGALVGGLVGLAGGNLDALPSF